MEVLERPTLAQVFRRFYPVYRQTSDVTAEQRRAAWCIQVCRTPALGEDLWACDQPPFAGPDRRSSYPSLYPHRTALSEGRLSIDPAPALAPNLSPNLYLNPNPHPAPQPTPLGIADCGLRIADCGFPDADR